VKTTMRTLTENDGVQIDEASLLSLQVLYRKIAQDDIRKYNAVSIANDLEYHRYEEESLVEAFANTIRECGTDYMKDPTAEQIPDWLRMISAMSDLRGKMIEAIPMKGRLQEKLMDAALMDLG
ncbi:MAG: hypothetical protein SVK08_06740, partial [Halobacteriota archaeon]|nr:hypothetical protein [Halobacteriota archaeon]